MAVSIKRIRQRLIKGEITLEEINNSYRDYIYSEYTRLLSSKVLTVEEFDEATDLIKLLIDYYIYSEDGTVLVTDHEYDMLLEHYINNGGQRITTSDTIKTASQWEFVEHESPGIVGSIKKVYTLEDLGVYLSKYCSEYCARKFRIAPKYDGISSAIKIENEIGNPKIVLAVTRNDGVKGMDITKVVREAKCEKNAFSHFQSAWVKTELVMVTGDFVSLNEEREKDGLKPYANRRSAVSAIVNSPKNLKYAKYLTVIPLAVHDLIKDLVIYCPVASYEVNIRTLSELNVEIQNMLAVIRDASFPIRTDGVVIYPLGNDMIPDFTDIMGNAIAFKVNTAEAYSTIEYGYVSLGRLSKATPMIHVKPVEVNEIRAQEASLGSFDKFAGLDLHEGEKVVVYAAGDVIPQIRLPDKRKYKKGAKLLKIKKRCPYCGEKLTRYKNTYYCRNVDCPRVITGKIVNFISKIGAKNISDKTIEALYQNQILYDVPSLFDITEDDIKDLDGFNEKSAHNIVSEIQWLKKEPIAISKLIGALGIQGISEKKCRVILKTCDIYKVLVADSSTLCALLLGAKGIGSKTANIFVDFIDDNRDLIEHLMKIMEITEDPNYEKNVAFTRFRDDELEKRFNDLGYEVSDNVNKDTVAVITTSYDHDSGKEVDAMRLHIPIVHLSQIEEFIGDLIINNIKSYIDY